MALQETDVSRKAHEAVRLAADEVAPLLAEEALKWTLVQREKVPDLAAYEDVREVSRQSTGAYFRLLTTILREELAPEAATPPPETVLAARNYARLGLPLTSVLRAFRLAHASFWKFWFGHLRRAVDDAEVLAEAVAYSSDMTHRFVDTIVSQVAAEYSAEQEQWLRSDAAARLEAMRELLGGGERGIAELERALGYPLERDHIALLLWSSPNDAPDYAGGIQRTAGRILAALSPSPGLVVPLGHLTVAAWSPSGRPDAAVALAAVEREDGVSVAVGEPGHGAEGFRVSYEEAEHARRSAMLIGRPAGSITAYRDVAFVALATADAAHARRFVERELGALAGDDDATLRIRSTLAVYFEAGSSVAETARRIGVHQNTIANRLQRAAKLRRRPLDERQIELRAALALFGAVARRPAAG